MLPRTEDDQSVGTHITFGRFRVLHLADLPWNREFELMCPANRIGDVDLWLVSRHGQPTSNSEALVHAIRPRVAIMNNGTRKGGQPDAMRIIHGAPRLEDLWQIHFSLLGGQEYTVPGLFIANSFDEPQAAMPIAAEPAPQPGAQAPPAPQHNGCGVLVQGLRANRRHIQRDQQPERLQQDVQKRYLQADKLLSHSRTPRLLGRGLKLPVLRLQQRLTAQARLERGWTDVRQREVVRTTGVERGATAARCTRAPWCSAP